MCCVFCSYCRDSVLATRTLYKLAAELWCLFWKLFSKLVSHFSLSVFPFKSLVLNKRLLKARPLLQNHAREIKRKSFNAV